ncbi:MAG TPA: DUF177 domain-containing protein [Candidatus Methylomirabilis sp.]|nr:DUF177 domain-containing protein [Candidatus Methylomirabilis sp.]
MIIRVADIPDEGLQIEGPGAFPHPFQDSAWALDDLSLTVSKDGEAVLVNGRLVARVPQLCGRCLEPYVVTVSPLVDARFVPNPRRRGDEVELGADDLETDVYDNGLLDLTTVLETETTLLLPMKPLCREDCRGLCPICGANRNVSSCRCAVTVEDPRWAPLKSWAARLSKIP